MFQSIHHFLTVSIHAPAKGATGLYLRFGRGRWVSIHAPAKGATFRFNAVFHCIQFQSTRPRRARPGIKRWISWKFWLFQSTRPRRARRRVRSVDSIGDWCFNPRAREGRDSMDVKSVKRGPCFNPRAREGRDYPEARYLDKRLRFNPRAREGRDDCALFD